MSSCSPSPTPNGQALHHPPPPLWNGAWAAFITCMWMFFIVAMINSPRPPCGKMAGMRSSKGTPLRVLAVNTFKNATSSRNLQHVYSPYTFRFDEFV